MFKTEKENPRQKNMNLSKYKIPMGKLPQSIEIILEKKTIELEFNDFRSSGKISYQELEDGVYKNKENSYFVKCTTEMKDVSPNMIDWWFSWFMPSSERYKLWHPRDHIASYLTQGYPDKSTNREKYLELDSFVDEYIGKKLHSLCISFVQPSSYGFKELSENEVAICASVRDMNTGIYVANLLHHVVANYQGSTMYSYFWMGMEPNHSNPLKDYLVKFLTKFKPLKAMLLNDEIAKDLSLHCYEEMNHLAKFLPAIYNDLGKR